MKGFLITIGLFLAGSIYFITSFPTIGKAVIDKVAVEEKGREAIDIAVANDEKSFIAKYRPLLERRWKVGFFANLLDDAYFLELSKESYDLYTDTPLETDPAFGHFIFQRAEALAQIPRPESLNESFSLYKKYLALFPAGPDLVLAKNSVSRMMTKYGMQ